jgi:hypothetical protein
VDEYLIKLSCAHKDGPSGDDEDLLPQLSFEFAEFLQHYQTNKYDAKKRTRLEVVDMN